MIKFKKPLYILGVVLLIAVAGYSAAKIKPYVYTSDCVGCGDCVVACPVRARGAIQVINGKAIINPEACIGCNICVQTCSYGAVTQ